MELIKFKIPVAYAKRDKLDQSFTKKDLETLAKSAKFPLMITDSFNYGSLPIGTCNNLKVKGKELIADITINPGLLKKNIDNSCFRISYTEIPYKILEIGHIDKANDVYEKEDK